MNWKEFFKPTIWKIMIFLLFLIITSVFNLATQCPGCTRAAHGFPLTLYELPGCEPTPPFFECPKYRLVYSGLLFNLIFWYLVSCGFIILYIKIRKKQLADLDFSKVYNFLKYYNKYLDLYYEANFIWAIYCFFAGWNCSSHSKYYLI